MKKFGKFLVAIVALLSVFAIFAAGCIFGGSGGTNSGSSGNGGSGSGGNNNNQQQEEPPAPEFESGSGTENDPYIISQPYQWTNINKHLSAYYELGADLNMGDITDLTPVGSDTAPFTGYLDGKNHKVHSATLNTALFGTISEGTVKNLNFADSTINKAMASFADTVKMGATVENCHTKSITMSSSNSYITISGLISKVASASNVKYCSSDINLSVTTDPNYIATLIGRIEGGHVDSCWATGSLSASSGAPFPSFYAGGIIYSISNGTVSNCYSKCTFIKSNFSNAGTGLIAYSRTGGEMEYCIDLNDFSSIYNNAKIELFESTTVTSESTLKYYSPSTIESSNDLLDTDEWKDNKLWKKGKLHPELVSYEEYLQLTAEN